MLQKQVFFRSETLSVGETDRVWLIERWKGPCTVDLRTKWCWFEIEVGNNRPIMGVPKFYQGVKGNKTGP